MIKRLREEWLYWRYRNITRRRQLLQARMRTRFRRRPTVPRAFRARGTAMYMPARSSNGRGILFAAAAAAVLAVVNYLIFPPFPDRRATSFWTWQDLLLLAVMTYAYIKAGRV